MKTCLFLLLAFSATVLAQYEDCFTGTVTTQVGEIGKYGFKFGNQFRLEPSSRCEFSTYSKVYVQFFDQVEAKYQEIKK